MVKLSKAEFDIFALRKTQGVNGWTATKAQRTRTRSTTFKQNIASTERKHYLKPKDDRTYMSGWMNVWRLDTGEQAIRKTQSKMVEATVQLGAISPRKAKKC